MSGITDIAQVTAVVARAVERGVEAAGERLEKEVRENATLTDHSLEDLARLGHPYSRQNPKPGALGHEAWKAHKQSGELERAIEVDVDRKGPAAVEVTVGVDEDRAPHAADVILGSERMVARDFLTESMVPIEDELFEIVEEAFLDGLGELL